MCCLLKHWEARDMDRFTVKTPRPANTPSTTTSPNKQTHQATIESLKGVVVVEDILRCKNALEYPKQDIDVLLSNLMDLKQKKPSKEILKSTGIGKVVHRLCKHIDDSVSALAREVYEIWKDHVVSKTNRPVIEVRTDKKTEDFRITAKKWISKSLYGTENTEDKLTELIEREVFHLSRRLVNTAYRKTIRRLVFALKNVDLRELLLKDPKKASQVVRQNWK